MTLKQKLLDHVVTPVTFETEGLITLGYIIEADDKNNCCTVRYKDKYGKITERENVTVRLTGNGMEWFPVPGEYVQLELGRGTCVIAARAVNDYSADIRSKMELKQDIYSDSLGAPPGASIY